MNDPAPLTPAQARVAAVAAQYDPSLVETALVALAQRQASAGKACPGCGRERSLREFGRDSRQRDGLTRLCRSCRSTASTRGDQSAAQ